MMGEDVKISLHASGQCQFSWTLKWWEKHSEDGVPKKDRHFKRWTVKQGTVLCLTIPHRHYKLSVGELICQG